MVRFQGPRARGCFHRRTLRWRWLSALCCGNDRQPRRITAPFQGKPHGGSWREGGSMAQEGWQPALLCRSGVIFLEAGPVITAGNYLKKPCLCPSLEGKLLRACSLAMCMSSSKHCLFLDAAVAQIAACFPIPDYFYCQAQSRAFCRAVVLC